MRRVLRWTMLVLACGFVLVQFSRPARTNPVTDETRALEAHVNVSPEVKAILARACDDCHSNRTHWPWYSHVAPVSWTVADHVRHGRRRMNFSDWARYDAREADYLLGDICKTAKQGIMPLNSYTLIHRNAFLSAADVGALCAWTQTARQQLAARGRKQESDARSQKPEGN